MKMQKSKWTIRVLLAAAFLAVSLASVPSVVAQEELPAASAVASPRAYVSTQPVPRGSTFEIGVVVGIMPGFHMNSHKPSEDYLIPTNLTAKLPAGIKEVETNYPEGVSKKLGFDEKPLSVYTGRFTVRMKFSAAANAPLGKIKLPLTLQYQACNDTACLPPVRIPVTAAIDVAPAGTKTHSISPEIFGKQD